MAKRPTTWDDSQTEFSGGLIEGRSPSAFSERSMAKVKGFVFESETELRSQPSVQKIGTQTSFTAVQAYTGSNGSYLIAIDSSGRVWYCDAPSPTATYQDTRNVSWKMFLNIPAQPELRFLLDNDVVVHPQYGRTNAVSLHHAGLGATGIKIVEVDDPQPGEFKLVPVLFDDLYPHDTVDANGVVQPSAGKFPAANKGVMLNSRLFLGDSFYSKVDANPFSADNSRHYASGVWYSELYTDTFFGLAYLYTASSEAQIRGMHVLDNKLILITTAGPSGDGLIVASGDFTGPASAASTGEFTANVKVDILRGGTGAPRQTTDRHRNYSCVWPETGTVCFIDRLGGVWSTEGQQVERVDVVGPKDPKTATEDDHVAALGKNLFVSRAKRLLVLTVLGTTDDEDNPAASAAWTELVTPSASQVMSMTPLDHSLYFIQDGQVYRYNFIGPALSERGYIDGTPVDLVIGTRTHGDPGRHDRKSWLRFGVRLRGTGPVPSLSSVRFRPGPVLSGGTGHLVTPLTTTVGERYQAYLNAGIGAQVEASAEMTFRGDVTIEEYSWTVNGVEPDR